MHQHKSEQQKIRRGENTRSGENTALIFAENFACKYMQLFSLLIADVEFLKLV